MFRLLPGILLMVAIDDLSKLWAERALALYQPVPILGDLFRLTLGYNSGVAFGIFANSAGWPVLLSGIIILALLVGIVGVLVVGKLSRAAPWPLQLILGGAIANFADRLLDGRVTDFLDVGLGASRWPAFNLADSFIVLGVAALMLGLLAGELVLGALGWRWASRRYRLPCPSQLAWLVDDRLLGPLNLTRTELDRLGLRPGMRVLEVGPGPGRLLVPAARRVLPSGEVVGLELQPEMARRLGARAAREGLSNLTVVLGDAAERHFEPESFDLVYWSRYWGRSRTGSRLSYVPTRCSGRVESSPSRRPSPIPTTRPATRCCGWPGPLASSSRTCAGAGITTRRTSAKREVGK